MHCFSYIKKNLLHIKEKRADRKKMLKIKNTIIIQLFMQILDINIFVVKKFIMFKLNIRILKLNEIFFFLLAHILIDISSLFLSQFNYFLQYKQQH